MEEGMTPVDRQNEAFLLRFKSDNLARASIFWCVVAAVVLYFHVRWLAIVFMLFATITLADSIICEYRASKLWPDPKDWR